MQTRSHIDGFAIPVRRSLTQPILMGGAPRNVTIANGTLAAALGLGLQLWVVGILWWLIFHALAVFMTKQDDQFLSVLIRHLKHKAYLSC